MNMNLVEIPSNSYIATTLSNSERTRVDEHQPKPDDLIAYLPWACLKFGVEKSIIINKTKLPDFSPRKSGRSASRLRTASMARETLKGTKSNLLVFPQKDVMQEKEETHPLITECTNCVLINAEYVDNFVVSMKFLNNSYIPRDVLKILALIVPFHPYFRYITINGGADRHTITALKNILDVSNVTEITLDDTFIPEANYYVLLDETNSLNNLSLARCYLNDAVVELIATRLIHPKPASRTLTALNLSSNIITDLGVKYLAEALRTNRKLSYLNLANNLINEDGGLTILKNLLPFQLNETEYKEHFVAYEKSLLTTLQTDIDSAMSRKEANKAIAKNLIPTLRSNKSQSSLKRRSDKHILEKYEKVAVPVVFSPGETFIWNRKKFCKGNFSLNYLNLEYNNLSEVFLKKLVQVVAYQDAQYWDSDLKGLMVAKICGNPLPTQCDEYLTLLALFDKKINKFVDKHNKVVTLDLRNKSPWT